MSLGSWSYRNPNGAWKSLASTRSALITELKAASGHRQIDLDPVLMKRFVKGHAYFSKHEPGKSFGFMMAHGLGAIHHICGGRPVEDLNLKESALVTAIALVCRTGARRGEIFPDKPTDPKLMRLGHVSNGTLKRSHYRSGESTMAVINRIMRSRYGLIYMFRVKHKWEKSRCMWAPRETQDSIFLVSLRFTCGSDRKQEKNL